MGRKNDMRIADIVGKPISEKMNLLNEAVHKDGEKTRTEFNNVKRVVDFIIEDLSAKEKKELYDLNTIVDIGSLEDTEKQFLVELLYTLANVAEQVTDTQQTFIRSVQNYLGIKTIQTMVNPAFIENIDNIPVQKAIIQVVQEFLFLEKNDHSYFEEYEDIFSYFSVNRSGIQQIQSAISNIFKATGAQGLAEKYGFKAKDTNEFISDIDIEEIVEILNGWKNIEFVSTEVSRTLLNLTINHGSEMYYFEDDMKTMSSCKKKAEEVLKNAFDEARSSLIPYGSNSISTLLAKDYFEYLEYDITKIQHHIRKLKDKNKAIDKLTLLETYIDPINLQQHFKESLQQELSDSYYQINRFESYSTLIEYTKWDTTGIEPSKGLWKILATAAGHIYYHFDCSAAWNKLQEDVTSKLENFNDSSENVTKSMIQMKCIDPIQYILKELNELE